MADDLFALFQENPTDFIKNSVKNGIDPEVLKSYLSEHLGIDYLLLQDEIVSRDALKYFNYEISDKFTVFPFKMENNKLYVAMENPLDLNQKDSLEMFTGLDIVPVFSESRNIRDFINKYYISNKISKIQNQFFEDSTESADENLEISSQKDIQNAPIVKLIDSLIESAVVLGASDIHIEPVEDKIRTRYRVDGHLREFKKINIEFLPQVISRLKIMGQMDIIEARLPQDGHFTRIENQDKIDFRISTAPTIYGEKAVIRIIYSSKKKLKIENLGFSSEDIEKLNMLLKIPYGVILVTGPTGSGKTTTLSGFLHILNEDSKNIITIEDPVENRIPGINQINTNPKAGLEFDTLLRSLLRQDPDILMIGEIRDDETAKTSIRAAITGHLVLSTLHTNDAVTAINRLADMGVERYLLTSSIRAVISQRLIRKLCPHCKEKTTLHKKYADLFNIPPDTEIYTKKGCSKCDNIGYKGRTIVYEILDMTPRLSDLIETESTRESIRAYLSDINFRTIFQCAKEKLVEGVTSLEEILTIYLA